MRDYATTSLIAIALLSCSCMAGGRSAERQYQRSDEVEVSETPNTHPNAAAKVKETYVHKYGVSLSANEW